MTPALVEALGRIVGPRWVRHRAAERATYAADGLPTHESLPGLVVLPGTREEVAAVLRLLGAHPGAIPLLARKIPHYGKYGYLGFSGDAAENSLKGQWTPDTAPLTVFLDSAHHAQLTAKQPPALAKLPPPFDADRMLADVKALAAMNGRGNGTKDLDDAIAYVLARMPSGATKSCDATNKSLCNAVATLSLPLPDSPSIRAGKVEEA